MLACTRYGNVMCSRGSVIPLFIDQIKRKAPITITDPNMTRFLMNLDEAVDLVAFAFEHAEPGDLLSGQVGLFILYKDRTKNMRCSMAETDVKKTNLTTAETSKATASTRQADNEMEIDLLALFYRFLEKAHWIILCALIGAAIAFGIVNYLVTPIYQATAKIYIVGSDTTISLSDLQIGSNLAADYQEVFKNWHVHELVDKRLNLDYSYTKLSQMLTVSNPSNTHVIYVSIKNPDPQEAKLIADTYAQVAREFIAAKMDMREPNIFEEARMPTSPVTPQKTRDIIIGFLLGALLAMVLITINFISDDKIRTTEDIAKVGKLPTLGLIPLQNMEQGTAQGNVKRAGRSDE